jgi:hypothetical protein
VLLFFLLYVEATAYSERPQKHSVLPPTSYRSAKPKKKNGKQTHGDTKAAAPNSAASSDCRDFNTRFPSRKTAQGHAWYWQLLGNQKKARSPTQKSQREQARERKARGDGGKKQATTNKQKKACREKQQQSRAKDTKENTRV